MVLGGYIIKVSASHKLCISIIAYVYMQGHQPSLWELGSEELESAELEREKYEKEVVDLKME